MPILATGIPGASSWILSLRITANAVVAECAGKEADSLDDFIINVEIIMLAHIHNAQGRSYPARIAADIDASSLSQKSRHAIEQVVLRKLRKLEKDGLVTRQLESGDPEKLGRALRNYCYLSDRGEIVRREALTSLLSVPSLMAQIGSDASP